MKHLLLLFTLLALTACSSSSNEAKQGNSVNDVKAALAESKSIKLRPRLNTVTTTQFNQNGDILNRTREQTNKNILTLLSRFYFDSGALKSQLVFFNASNGNVSNQLVSARMDYLYSANKLTEAKLSIPNRQPNRSTVEHAEFPIGNLEIGTTAYYNRAVARLIAKNYLDIDLNRQELTINYNIDGKPLSIKLRPEGEAVSTTVSKYNYDDQGRLVELANQPESINSNQLDYRLSYKTTTETATTIIETQFVNGVARKKYELVDNAQGQRIEERIFGNAIDLLPDYYFQENPLLLTLGTLDLRLTGKIVYGIAPSSSKAQATTSELIGESTYPLADIFTIESSTFSITGDATKAKLEQHNDCGFPISLLLPKTPTPECITPY